MQWVLIANSNECRIYSYDKKLSQVTCVKTIEHPENKLKTSEIVTDRPGHYALNGNAHGAYSQMSDPHETQIDNFAREITRFLDDARNAHTFDQLTIIVPPHVDGLLNKHLDKHVKTMIKKTVLKNMIHLKEHELVDFFKENV